MSASAAPWDWRTAPFEPSGRRPPLEYIAERALEHDWDPLVAFPLRVTRDEMGPFLVMLSAGRVGTTALLPDGSFQRVGVGEIVAVPWSLQLADDVRVSYTVAREAAAAKRGIMVLHAVACGAAPLGIAAAILSGGDGRFRERAGWEVMVTDPRVPNAPRYTLAELEPCVGRSDKLLELLGGRVEFQPSGAAVVRDGGSGS